MGYLISIYIITASIFGRILLRSSTFHTRAEYHSRCCDFMRRFIHVESTDTAATGHGHGASTEASLQT